MGAHSFHDRKTILPLAVCVLLLSACNVEVPSIKSGYVENNTGASYQPNSARTVLTSLQIKQLAEWLSAHQDGWKFGPSDVFSYTTVTLEHGDGKSTVIGLAGEQIWIKGRSRILTAKERREIQGILDFVVWQP